MANVLIAASVKPREIMERLLASHELACAETMRQAEKFLRKQTFDLIVCTVAFDESRMFDFLRLVKSTAEWQRIPFVCARARLQILRSPIAMEAVKFTCRALGAVAFVDIGDYRSDPEGEMRKAIEGFIT
jgi:hypothetical protein